MQGFGRPRYSEFDPTLLVFLTFPAMFGFMIGDAGYGVLYAAIGYVLYARDEGAPRALGPVGILTNGPERRQRTKIRALGLEPTVDAIVYAGDLSRRKPHVDPFEAILTDLGVAADRTLYVGDSLAYDVAGAHNAGLQVAWLRGDGDDPGEYAPEYVLDSLAHLDGLLDG